jgi:hypothetical protein
MISRKLVAGSVCLGCLVFGGLSLSQERTRDVRREATTGTLERRVVELERQLKSLTQEVEALRKEVLPAATRPSRPKPLSGDFR